MIPPAAERTTKRALRDCDLFVIGTSGRCRRRRASRARPQYSGAWRILLNLEIYDEAREVFTGCRAGTSDELVPRWFA
jgi:hypothetical protein